MAASSIGLSVRSAGTVSASVYLSDTWCCRHCGHLAYPSENEDELERLRSKALKLKESWEANTGSSQRECIRKPTIV